MKNENKLKIKKAAIILIALAFIVGIRNLATKQAGAANENINALQFCGIYTFGDDPEARNGEVYIYPETDSTFIFYLFVIQGAPSYNLGTIDGRVTIINNKATFRKRYEPFEMDCVLNFEFSENMLAITEDDDACGCPFGYGVYINDTFQRVSSEIPQYYTSLENEKVYFSQWQEDLTLVEDEETEEREYLVTESDWEGVKCEEDDRGIYQKCTFPNANLQQVYNIVRKKVLELKAELPASNTEYGDLNAGDAIVTYTYLKPKHLHIQSNSGVTVEIIENKNETQSIISYLPD
jgi:hypothetical protein